MVLVAEWLRRRIVVPVYVGSIPTAHPIITGSTLIGFEAASSGARGMLVRVQSSRQIAGIAQWLVRQLAMLETPVRFWLPAQGNIQQVFSRTRLLI